MDKINGEHPANDAPGGRFVAGLSDLAIDDDVTAAVVRRNVGVADNDSSDRNSGIATVTSFIEAAPTNDPDDEVLEPGFILKDRFEIVALIHTGGMGHVYKAVDRRRHQVGSDQVHVAIKMMRRSVSARVDARVALEREASKTQRLSHPNIINIFDFDEHDGQFFLVVEWLDGESVNTLLRRTSGRPLALNFAWQVIQGIAAALQHAHSNNVVHADVNPSNIFITDTQEIKLLDFGAAKYASDTSNAPEDSPIWATHTYASPEVLSGRQPTFGDDIFSFGCVAYRLLSGRHPFAALRSSEAKEKSMSVQPIFGLPAAQWQVLRAALAYERADRPISADAFLIDVPSKGVRPKNRKARQKSHAMWPAAAGLFVAIVLAAGLTWFSARGEKDESTVNPAVADTSDQAIEAVALPDESVILDALLRAAALAIQEERYVAPVADNAIAYYREVLEVDATNTVALRGLRMVSDRYIKGAYAALGADDPVAAIAALDFATDADPENPAITIVNDLLVAKATSELASARLAAAQGDVRRATALISSAESYGHTDRAEIESVKRQIASVERKSEYSDQLENANADIAEGRLIAPVGENAFEILFELQQTHGEEADVVAAKEQLIDRLLNRAEFAIADEQFDEATKLLSAAGGLGISRAEVDVARTTLQQAVSNTEEATVQSALVFDQIEEIVPTSPVTDQAPIQPSATEAVVSLEQAPLDEKNVQQAPGMRIVRLSDLKIENYAAPRFPRRAAADEISGVVELSFNVGTDGTTKAVEIISAEPGNLFVSSARNAVLQWRFTERNDEVTTRVRLRFDWSANRRTRR